MSIITAIKNVNEKNFFVIDIDHVVSNEDYSGLKNKILYVNNPLVLFNYYIENLVCLDSKIDKDLLDEFLDTVFSFESKNLYKETNSIKTNEFINLNNNVNFDYYKRATLNTKKDSILYSSVDQYKNFSYSINRFLKSGIIASSGFLNTENFEKYGHDYALFFKKNLLDKIDNIQDLLGTYFHNLINLFTNNYSKPSFSFEMNSLVIYFYNKSNLIDVINNGLNLEPTVYNLYKVENIKDAGNNNFICYHLENSKKIKKNSTDLMLFVENSDDTNFNEFKSMKLYYKFTTENTDLIPFISKEECTKYYFENILELRRKIDFNFKNHSVCF